MHFVIAPEYEEIIVLKSAVAFRAAYEAIAGEIIEVNSPGLSSVDLQQFEFRKIRRPLFPFDPDAKFLMVSEVEGRKASS